MNFKAINDILGFYPNLRVLERNSQPYYLLLYQHTGTLVATNERIGNPENDKMASAALSAFFELGKHQNIDLALAPEYCCPWQVVQDVIGDNNKWPSNSKLWVVGCESISKEEIVSFKEKNLKEDVFVHFDESLLGSNNNFFDPVLYIFKTNNKGLSRLNLIIQFKTYPMSVWSGGEIEANNIILGKEIYIFCNEKESINFFTLNCSEAMNFHDDLPTQSEKIGWLDKPFLIYNPQANGEPAHPRFTAFRKFVLEKSNKEIIELNWHIKSKIRTQDLIKYGSSRSGIMVNSDEVDQTNEQRIRNNHDKGMYYYFYGNHKHAFICNSTVNAFILRTSSAAIAGVNPLQSKRSGPEIINTYNLNGDNIFEQSADTPDDLSIEYLQKLKCSNPFLTDNQNCILEKERLVCLTSAEIEKGTSEWFHLNSLFSIKLDDSNEINRRITISEDTSIQSTDQRKKYIRAINEIENIIMHQKGKFPLNISELKSETLILGYHQNRNGEHKKLIEIEKYKYNITNDKGERIIATLCYLDHPSDDDLENKFRILKSLFDDNPHQSNIVIFYKRNGVISAKQDDEAGKIIPNNNYTSNSFLKS